MQVCMGPQSFQKCMTKLTPAAAAAAAAKLLQSCLTLCNPIDYSPPGSPIPGNLQARTLEWGAISFSNAWKWKVKVKSLSRVWLFVIPWTAAYQAPPRRAEFYTKSTKSRIQIHMASKGKEILDTKKRGTRESRRYKNLLFISNLQK